MPPLKRFVGLLVAAVLLIALAPPVRCQTTQPVITEQQQPYPAWTITTATSEYRIGVAKDGVLVPLYFGPRGAPPVQANLLNPKKKVGSTIREVPFRGGFPQQVPAIEVVFADGTRDTDLVYDSAKIGTSADEPTLAIELVDKAYNLHVTAHYRVLPALDLIEKWLVVRNDGEQPITLENAQSGSFELAPGEYDMTHLAGEWAREYVPFTERVTPGRKSLEVRDFQAFQNPPFVTLRRLDEAGKPTGDAWFASLHYSGNWRLDIDKRFSGEVQVVGGINFWDTALHLKPKQEFTTPRMVIGFAPDGSEGVARRMHDYVRHDVLPAKMRDRLRPVLYNSWFATEFKVSQDQQVALAKVAKEMGVELFVIDDGWFKGRNNDHAGLGDWVADPKKFPQGLGPMIKQVNDLGMDFGIWVEPEAVNADSDLYRAHPDWVLNYPKRERHEQRNQLVLNLAREDVYQYLLDSMTRLLHDNNIKYIKWDRNRGITEPGWPDAPPDEQRAVRIKYVENLYKLIDELRSRFPDVLFESCAGGGGRPDLGMLDRMDQMWPSDNTNPTDRLFIQSGYLRYLPPNTMVSWVTDDNWHHSNLTLKYRFHAAMCGVLGIGGNVTKWSDADRKEAANLVALYKEIRPIVQHGNVYQLLDPRQGQRVAVQYVSPDGNDAVVFLFNLRDELSGLTESSRASVTLRLRGLDSGAQYAITGDRKETRSGRSLLDAGIPWFVYNDYNSAVIRLHRTGGGR